MRPNAWIAGLVTLLVAVPAVPAFSWLAAALPGVCGCEANCPNVTCCGADDAGGSTCCEDADAPAAPAPSPERDGGVNADDGCSCGHAPHGPAGLALGDPRRPAEAAEETLPDRASEPLRALAAVAPTSRSDEVDPPPPRPSLVPRS